MTTQDIARQLSKDPGERQRQLEWLRKHAAAEDNVLEQKRLSDLADIELKRLEIAELDRQVEDDKREDLERRLREREREKEQQVEHKAQLAYLDKVARVEARLEDRDRVRDDTAAIDVKFASLRERLKALRIKKSYHSPAAPQMTPADERHLAELERLAEKYGWSS